MKRLIPFLLLAGLGVSVGLLWMVRSYDARYASELERQQAVWQAEKAELEAALELARAQARVPEIPIEVAATPAPPVALTGPSPADVMARLRALRSPVAPAQMREALYWMEELVQAGPAALPAIREFL